MAIGWAEGKEQKQDSLSALIIGYGQRSLAKVPFYTQEGTFVLCVSV